VCMRGHDNDARLSISPGCIFDHILRHRIQLQTSSNRLGTTYEELVDKDKVTKMLAQCSQPMKLKPAEN
jgi:hypothetical protein